jgi:hypothetical protein
LDELLWFWPQEPSQSEGRDDAIVAIKRHDYVGAEKSWTQQSRGSNRSELALHNLAVLNHLLALDHECMTNRPILEMQKKQRKYYWQEAYANWGTLLESRVFWSYLSDLAKRIDDPRLDEQAIRSIQADLPVAILSINISLAAKAKQNNDNEEFLFHSSLVNGSGFSKEALEHSFGFGLTPIRQRIKIICSNEAVEVKKTPQKTDVAINDLIKQTQPLLGILDGILCNEHAIRIASHDEIAISIVNWGREHSRAGNWRSAVEIFEKAKKIASSPSVLKDINESIEICKSNLIYTTCWFCNKRPAIEKAIVEVTMHGDVTRVPSFISTQVRWKQIKPRIPRCGTCKSIHREQNNIQTAGWVVGIILGAILWYVTQNFLVGVAAFIGCGIVGLVIKAVMRPPGIKSESNYKQFPSIKKLLAEGWAFGEKPSGVQ